VTPPLPVGGGEATHSQRLAAEDAVAARAAELELTRAAAGKWQTGLTALLAVVTGLSFTSISDQVRGLDQAWPMVATFGLFTAYAAAIGALLLAMRASGGIPRLVSTGTSTDGSHLSATAAAKHLKWAIWLTLTALAVFAVTVLVLWFAPRPAEKKLAELRTSTARICGRVEIIDGGHLLVTDVNDAVHVIGLSNITSWSRVAACPRG
jgi:hypothetical protein